MTKLFDDGRGCTADINAALADMEEQRQGPTFECEVGFIKRAYVFSHFDSRGGSTLLVAPDPIRAMLGYNVACGWEPFDRTAHDDLANGGEVELAIVGRELRDDDGDLLVGYAEFERFAGYALARVERRWYDELESAWRPWEQEACAVLYSVSKEDYEAGDGDEAAILALAPSLVAPKTYLRTEYRLVAWSVGEDACGLVFVSPAEVRDLLASVSGEVAAAVASTSPAGGR